VTAWGGEHRRCSRSFLSEHGPDLFLSPPAPEIGVIFMMDRGHSVRAKTGRRRECCRIVAIRSRHSTASKWPHAQKVGPAPRCRAKVGRRKSSVTGATGNLPESATNSKLQPEACLKPDWLSPHPPARKSPTRLAPLWFDIRSEVTLLGNHHSRCRLEPLETQPRADSDPGGPSCRLAGG
jgi:hypothetical protein